MRGAGRHLARAPDQRHGPQPAFVQAAAAAPVGAIVGDVGRGVAVADGVFALDRSTGVGVKHHDRAVEHPALSQGCEHLADGRVHRA